ncbi:hypothetical protein K2Z83_23515 [Oscillochloris sp. ZM17-4]|nr:hypothetical protein [Oscillochloris sp. ZM17-4]MBX0330631.1 hypothetical protein [Oscillochloris sp. ZM17-4]
MSDLINLFPSVLLGVMIVLTLVLLPLLSDDRAPAEERQRTDEIRAPK